MTDIEIANSIEPKRINDIVRLANLSEDDTILYGKDKAKIAYKNIKEKRKGKLILVTAINPTPYGEGKTTVSIGLGDAFRKLNINSLMVLREPSLGPVFGLKGGATGGGYSQVIPMEDINLHFNGDFHAITTANNLICAAIDNELYFGNKLQLDPDTISFSRCIDMNDRALRKIMIGLSSPKEVSREERVNITAASEMMGILCLAKDIDDLKKRVDNIFIGYTYDKKPIYAKDLNVSSSVAVLLKDAINPNLVQTLEHNPVIIHGGPFANVLHGCNSIIATDLGLKLADYVITEAGFGSDLGAEKFFDIKCQVGGFTPNAVVLVCTIKALKYNAGIVKEDILKENTSSVKQGLSNLEVHIENLKKYKVPFMVTLNKYNTDSASEIKIVEDYCLEKNIPFAICDSYAKGSDGALALAKKVITLADMETNFKPLYNKEESIYQKIEKIAKEIYHAKEINYSQQAIEKINNIIRIKKDKLPICIAKTQYSISDDPKKLGYPKDYTLNISDVRLYSGAGLITVLLGSIMTMPGFPEKANYKNIDIKDGKISGLF